MEDKFLETYQLLNEHEIDYMLIGGQAAMMYGVPRASFDIDIWIKKDMKNCEKLKSTMEKIGFGIAKEISAEEIYQKPIFIFQDQIELTIFTSLGGADDYDTCKKRAQKIKISDVEVSIINKEDLIKSKMFSNRPIDREDVKYLKKL